MLSSPKMANVHYKAQRDTDQTSWESMTCKWVSLLTSGDNNPSYHFQMSVSSSLLGSASSLQLEIYDRDLPVSLVLRICLAMQGTQVSSLAGELRFHTPLATARVCSSPWRSSVTTKTGCNRINNNKFLKCMTGLLLYPSSKSCFGSASWAHFCSLQPVIPLTGNLFPHRCASTYEKVLSQMVVNNCVPRRLLPPPPPCPLWKWL